MAGNRRGRIKERMEGIHKNLDWVVNHCQEILALIGDDSPKLSKGIEALGKGAQQLDECAKGIYQTV